MLFKPSYMNPYSLPIDATVSNLFSCYLNAEGGTQINKYNLMIKDLKGNQVYSTGDRALSPVLYNNDILNVTIPTNTGMINGLDYVWNVKLYESTPANWVTYGTVQAGSITTSAFTIRKHFNVSVGMYIKIGTELRKIVSYDKATGILTLESAFSFTPVADGAYNIYSDFIESDDTYFKARKAPVVSITNHTSIVTGKSYTFIGAYSQSDNIGWKYFTWNLYSNGELAKSTGQMNTGEIKFSFDGFLNNTSYSIELLIETQDEIVVSTGQKSFTSQYAVTSIINNPFINQLDEKNALNVMWEQPYINLYTQPTNFEYIKDIPFTDAWSVSLQKGDLIYNISTSAGKVFIPYESTTFLNIQFETGFEGEFYRQENTQTGEYYSIRYDDGVFIYDINSYYTGKYTLQSSTSSWLLAKAEDFDPYKRYMWDDNALWDDSAVWCEQEFDIVTERWFKITLLPDMVKIHGITEREDVFTGTVDGGSFIAFAFDDIDCGTFINNAVSELIDCDMFIRKPNGYLPTNGYDRVTLFEGAKVDYLWIENNIANNNQIATVNDFYYTPIWTRYTSLLANFRETLAAGNVITINEQIIKWDIYKKRKQDTQLKYVNTVDAKINNIVDHNTANQTEYQYHIFPITQNTVGEAMLSPFVKTNWVGWTLLSASPSGKENVYYADPKNVWTFRFNLGNNMIMQNFDRMIYEGHTKYPKVSTGERSYHSGNVNCLMGYVENSAYIDTAQMQHDFEEFIHSETQKVLKDGKGNIYLVEIMQNTFTADNTLEQAVTLNFEWCENGDAEKISVIERHGG